MPPTRHLPARDPRFLLLALALALALAPGRATAAHATRSKPSHTRAKAPAKPAPQLPADELARLEFDKIVYATDKAIINFDRPQPLLRAVVVLRVTLDAQDQWHAEVFRENDEQPEMTRVALDSVARLPPPVELSAPTLALLRGEGLIEAWLFQNNGHFALKSLARPQRGL